MRESRSIALSVRTGIRLVLPAPGLLYRSVRYLASRSVPPTILVLLAVIFSVEGGLEGTIVAIAGIVTYIIWSVATIDRERSAVTILGKPPISSPHRDQIDGPRQRTWRERSRDPSTRRECLHAILALIAAPVETGLMTGWLLMPILVATPVLVGDGPVAVGPFSVSSATGAWSVTGFALVLILLIAHLLVAIANVHASITTYLLGLNRDELEARVRELTRSRSRLIDAFDIERRRIERDLHDGAQQQLVSLAMTLDLARIELESDPNPTVESLIDQAHSQTTSTLRELRQLIEGIHPAILEEQGMPAAVQELCDRSAIPVKLDSKIGDREFSSPVASTAYFVVAEALTNAAKHSGASEITVRLAMEHNTLAVQVEDNGVGGADPDGGTGLPGLADRIRALDGEMTLSSPAGGPTVILARIPIHDHQEDGR